MQESTIPSTNNYPYLKIEEIIIGPRHRQDLGDIAALAKSIREVGLLCPVAVTQDRRLIAGWRRLEAVKELGWTEVPVHILDGLDDALDVLLAERDENKFRKNFTPSEAASMAKALKDLEREKALQRQKEGGKKGAEETNRKLGRKTNESGSPIIGEPDHMTDTCDAGAITTEAPGETQEKVAEALGMSAERLRQAEAVVEAAENDPETFGPVKEEMDKTGKVNPAYKKVHKRKAAIGQADPQKNKSASTEEQPTPKKAKQRRDRDEMIHSWERQPNESGQEWLDRLKVVQDKDKIGLKREFEVINVKAWRFSFFKIDEQIYEIACLLVEHRDRYWPEEFRSQFRDIILRAAEFADKKEEELDAAFGEPDDDF